MIIGHGRLRDLFVEQAKAVSLSHGYIFFGPAGVGKRAFALALANFFETKEFDSPARVLNDVSEIVPNAEGTIGIDAVRNIKNFLWQTPNVSTYRTLVLSDADTLTSEAQNALLKVTEDPPRSALLIVVVRDPELLIPTLRSRLQPVYFGPVAEKELVAALEKDFKVKAVEAKKAAEAAHGLPGVALRALAGETVPFADAVAKFMRLTHGEYKAEIKEMVGDDNFKFSQFLDELIRRYALDPKKDSNAWHAMLELRRKLDFSPLSPRIQLENLYQIINKF